MPMRVSAINERRERFTLPWGDEDAVHVTYAAGRFDSMTQNDLNALQERFNALSAVSEDDGDAEAKAKTIIADLLCTFVVAWDVLGDDDAPFPLVSSTIAAGLAWRFNLAVMMNVFADYAAKKENGMPSLAPTGAGSSAAPGASPSISSPTS